MLGLSFISAVYIINAIRTCLRFDYFSSSFYRSSCILRWFLNSDLFFPEFLQAISRLSRRMEPSNLPAIAETTSETRYRSLYSDKRTFDDDPFTSKTLPLLVKHYKREALSELQKQHHWIRIFESSSQEADFSGPRNEFFRHGSDCINTLDQYSELLRIGVGNDLLTKSGVISRYAWFIYELSKTPSDRRVRDWYLETFSQSLDKRFRYNDLETEVDPETRLFFDEAKRAARREVASWADFK